MKTDREILLTCDGRGTKAKEEALERLIAAEIATMRAHYEELLSKGAEAMGAIRFFAILLELNGPQWSEEPGFGARVTEAALKWNKDHVSRGLLVEQLRKVLQNIATASRWSCNPFDGQLVLEKNGPWIMVDHTKVHAVLAATEKSAWNRYGELLREKAELQRQLDDEIANRSG